MYLFRGFAKKIATHNKTYFPIISFDKHDRDDDPKFFFVPIHRSYFCVCRTDGAARIYFFLSLSLPERVTLWSRIIPVHVREREREVRRKRKKKKAQKKPLRRDRDLNPQTLSPEPSVLSIRPRRPALVKKDLGLNQATTQIVMLGAQTVERLTLV